MLNRFAMRAFAAALFMTASNSALAFEPGDPPPNIIYVMLDDLAYSDFDDPTIITPYIDAFRDEALTFTHFYTAPVCSPTRSATLFGRDPLTFGIVNAVSAGLGAGVPDEFPSVAEELSLNGFHTAHIGKWHLGSERASFLPTAHGFAQTVTYDLMGSSNTGYINPDITLNDDPTSTSTKIGHKTEILMDYAISQILALDETSPPLFLNLWLNTPHKPVTPPIQWSSRYGPSDEEQFKAFMSHADEQFGRLLNALNVAGVAHDTLLILTGDNGPTKSNHDIESLPLNGAKATVFQGGVRLPLIARWPAVIDNAVSVDSPITAIDLAPTFLEIAGAPSPDPRFSGTSFLNLLTAPSQSTFNRSDPLFWTYKNKANQMTDPARDDTYAVRDGKWKLIVDPDATYLFNLRNDPEESNNQAALKPGKVKALTSLYQDWKLETAALPFTASSFVGDATAIADGFSFGGAGAVVLDTDNRFDFGVRDFSFAAIVNKADLTATGQSQVIAEKAGGWRLAISATGELEVVLTESNGAVTVTGGPVIPPNQDWLAGFTVLTFKNDPPRIALFSEPYQAGIEPIAAIHADGPDQTAFTEAPVTIGGDAAAEQGFAGTITRIRPFITRLTPMQMETAMQ